MVYQKSVVAQILYKLPIKSISNIFSALKIIPGILAREFTLRLRKYYSNMAAVQITVHISTAT